VQKSYALMLTLFRLFCTLARSLRWLWMSGFPCDLDRYFSSHHVVTGELLDSLLCILRISQTHEPVTNTSVCSRVYGYECRRDIEASKKKFSDPRPSQDRACYQHGVGSQAPPYGSLHNSWCQVTLFAAKSSGSIYYSMHGPEFRHGAQVTVAVELRQQQLVDALWRM